MTEFGKPLRATSTPIPGLMLWDLPVHGDSRGWFKENWQREAMAVAGLPDFGPVQNNISFNDAPGTTRGIHAEPWDKWVSVAAGRIFGAWVDLREGPSFGAVFTAELDPSRAVFVPRGVGNAFQTLEADTAYTYLVNEHWSPDAQYTFLNLADETVAIEWPIALDRAALSDKDRAHPRLADVTPVPPLQTLVIGAHGQLGRALRGRFGGGARYEYVDRAELDIGADLTGARQWRDYDVIINAAAYTAVDQAETASGRTDAWLANAAGPAQLARIAAEHGITLIHISTDYVFDGESRQPYDEESALSPLGVYGQTKAAADLAVATCPRHYIVRTSWVIGDGGNFVRTMAGLAEKGVAPRVVDDQVGRPTFAEDLAGVIVHLLAVGAAYGTYNFTSDGAPVSWRAVAKRVFELTGHDPERVSAVSTADYYEGATGPVSPRPRTSTLDLAKIRSVGFVPPDWDVALVRYLSGD
jgi:dTDP-4-dehydrorhamnose 3,5-epimerase